MTSLLSLFLVSATIWPAVQATSSDSNSPAPFTLTISAQPDTVKVGQEVCLHIVLKNSSGQGVMVKRSPGDFAERFYEIHVTDASGQEVPMSDYGKAARAQQLSGSVIKVRANPGDTIEENAWLGKMFAFPSPGDYLVQVFRPASDGHKGGLVASNKVAIKITP